MKVIKFVNKDYLSPVAEFSYKPYLDGKTALPESNVVECVRGWHGCKLTQRSLREWFNSKVLVLDLVGVQKFDNKVAGETGYVLPELTAKAQEIFDRHRAACDKAWAARDKVWDARDKAQAACVKALAARDKALESKEGRRILRQLGTLEG